ncbi:hypothetical protein CMUST_10880 [Corynebacterium mustelae]|uniref:PPE family protein n=1 Tax=Corynebacterium mustelae TaxID=571915 RepID=A0A0G3GZ95_9CORY|nr:hypothetical protein [Corynebacterium mustelae]AKK06491.1 hypothetical protein CMUST_10880 [Corynebacterium mustelae]
MSMLINSPSFVAAFKSIQDAQVDTHSLLGTTLKQTLSGGFSSLSGLHELGLNHAQVIQGGAGSARDVLASFRDLVEWLGMNLRLNHVAFTGHDLALSRGLDTADSGGTFEHDIAEFASKPAASFADFPFLPPTPVPSVSLETLVAQLGATQSGQAAQAAADWQSMATYATSIATQLEGIASQLSAQNQGVAVLRATAGMKATAAKASYFAANATEMARSVGILSTIAPHFHTQASQALSALQTIANPAEKEAAEKAYLTAFHGIYSGALSQAVPVIRNLMIDNSPGLGGGSATIGSDSTGAPPAPTTNALSPAGMGTQAASTATLPVTGGGVGTPTAPVSGMPPITGLPTGAGPGGSGVGGAPVFSGLTPGMGGNNRSGLSGGGSIPASGGLRPGHSATSGGRSTTGTSMGAGMNGLGGYGMAGGTGSAGMRGGTGGAGGRAFGSGGRGFGTGMGPGGGVGVSPKTPNATGSGSGGVGNGTSAGAKSAAGAGGANSGGRAGTPMIGAPIGGQNNNNNENQRKRKKPIRGITTSVERDVNLKALLGEQPKVIPGVIGNWVRE